jgi:deoxyxylulose-5-phosphate synthase
MTGRRTTVYDLSYGLHSNLTIIVATKSNSEYDPSLQAAFDDGPTVMRYPRGTDTASCNRSLVTSW